MSTLVNVFNDPADLAPAPFLQRCHFRQTQLAAERAPCLRFFASFAPPSSGSDDRVRRCDYCGRENEDSSAYCSGCGTPFPPGEPPGPAQPPPIPEPARLNARRATYVFLFALGAQFLAGAVVGAVGSVVFVVNTVYTCL